MRPFYYTRWQSEERAYQLLVALAREVGGPPRLPIDVDLLGEVVCNITWDWANIPEPPGRVVWARLLPISRRVELNERHQDRFSHNTGLERYTRAHEIGHWALHTPPSVDFTLPTHDDDPLHRTGEPVIFCRGNAADLIERQAEWFAAGLLMPRGLVLQAAEQLDARTERGLRDLRDLTQVSWRALDVRLNQLDVPHFRYEDIQKAEG